MPRAFVRKGSGHEIVFDMRVQGAERMYHVVKEIREHIGEATSKVMESYAHTVATDALAKTRTDHPRNLFRGKSRQRLHPQFNVVKVGDYYWRVMSATGKSGRSQALAEFAEVGWVGQGGALTRALNNVYSRRGGPGNGRVLWATYDRYEDGLMADFREAAEKAAEEINKETS